MARRWDAALHPRGKRGRFARTNGSSLERQERRAGNRPANARQAKARRSAYKIATASYALNLGTAAFAVGVGGGGRGGVRRVNVAGAVRVGTTTASHANFIRSSRELTSARFHALPKSQQRARRQALTKRTKNYGRADVAASLGIALTALSGAPPRGGGGGGGGKPGTASRTARTVTGKARLKYRARTKGNSRRLKRSASGLASVTNINSRRPKK